VCPRSQARLQAKVSGRERAGHGEPDDHGRCDPAVARHGWVLGPHRVDDPVAMLIEPLGASEQESRVVVPGDPELPVSVVVRDELDSLPHAREYRVGFRVITQVHSPLIPAASIAATAIGEIGRAAIAAGDRCSYPRPPAARWSAAVIGEWRSPASPALRRLSRTAGCFASLVRVQSVLTMTVRRRRDRRPRPLSAAGKGGKRAPREQGGGAGRVRPRRRSVAPWSKARAGGGPGSARRRSHSRSSSVTKRTWPSAGLHGRCRILLCSRSPLISAYLTVPYHADIGSAYFSS
jgi:hypothetical protein